MEFVFFYYWGRRGFGTPIGSFLSGIITTQENYDGNHIVWTISVMKSVSLLFFVTESKEYRISLCYLAFQKREGGREGGETSC
jgi:hypothetical protein